MAYIYQDTHNMSHYIDEGAYSLFSNNGVFWNRYFNQNVWIPITEYNFNNLLGCKSFEINNLQVVLNQAHAKNIEILSSYMNKLWILNPHTLGQLSSMKSEITALAEPYVTVVLRGGDKATLEKHLKLLTPTDVAEDFLRRNLTETASAVHVVTDTYSFYESLLDKMPKSLKIFTTCKPDSTEGFVLSSVKHWSAERKREEVLLTLLNYEIARGAVNTIMARSSNIAVWIALLRLMDRKPFQFYNHTSNNQFPYFGGVLPASYQFF